MNFEIKICFRVKESRVFSNTVKQHHQNPVRYSDSLVFNICWKSKTKTSILTLFLREIPDRLCGPAHPPIHLGTGGSFPGGKAAGAL